MSEKSSDTVPGSPLPPAPDASSSAPPTMKSSKQFPFVSVAVSTLVAVLLYLNFASSTSFTTLLSPAPSPPASSPVLPTESEVYDSALYTCPQSKPIVPANSNLDQFKTPEFREWSLSVLQKAVRIPTQSFDNMGPVGKDSRWDVFFDLEAMLKDSFPLVHKHLSLEHINTHGLVYTWDGTDASLKPTMFMGHQDVVPVLNDSLPLWTNPPFSAYFDGDKIWGRGASDDKGSLVAVLEAIEKLLTEGTLQPRRTIILAFGFDEEISGYNGAAFISQHLQQKYGEKSIYSIVDEGGFGVLNHFGVNFALPGVSEKGMYDSKVVLKTPGGHSSMPPDHTSIGIVGRLAALMEDTPFEPSLDTKTPIYSFLQCIAAHSDEISDRFKSAIRRSGSDPAANAAVVRALSKRKLTKYMIQTSQAIDIIYGGLKINALPEQVSLATNYRIDFAGSVDQTRQKVVDNVLEIAHKFNLGVTVNKTAESGEYQVSVLKEATPLGNFVISDYGHYVEPAPMSSTYDSEAWETFSGTIRHVFQDFAKPIIDPTNPTAVNPKQEVVVSPAIMAANTDTKHYWALSDNIYRFSPYRVLDTTLGNIHTVDEYIPLDVHIEAVAFYYTYILNL